MKGSQLGRGYSFLGLQREQGIDYDPARDNVDLLRRRTRLEAGSPPGRGGEAPATVARTGPVARHARAQDDPKDDAGHRAARPLARRALLNLASQALPPEQRAALRLWRKVIDISHGRER